jgi:predicted nuclease of predicted toxin-antitoxin system
LAGHDVSTVREQQLLGVADEQLFAVSVSESRALITLDHDFGHVLRFPPSKSAGIVILETTPRAEVDTLLARIRDLITVLQDRELTSELWIMEPGRLRIHQSNDD